MQCRALRHPPIFLGESGSPWTQWLAAWRCAIRKSIRASGSISGAAQRMRRHRERRRHRLRCVSVELRETEISALVRRGLLHPDARSEPSEIVRALYDYLDRTLGR
jgi:hypothetical protein